MFIGNGIMLMIILVKNKDIPVGQCLLTVVSLMLLLQPTTDVIHICYDCCYMAEYCS